MERHAPVKIGRPAGRATLAPAIASLVAGAVALGISPVFVRLADVGPVASAFWRVTLALPLLLVWSTLERSRTRDGCGDPGALLAAVAAGTLFAGLLVCWHRSILETTIATATFLATFTPIWVACGSALLLAEPVAGHTLAGIGVCLIGGALLVGQNLSPSEAGSMTGDLFGLATSIFFGGFILAVRRARRALGSGCVLLIASGIASVLLLPAALELDGRLFPATLAGWGAVTFLAVVTHVIGQGLVAVALGSLSAAFSALVIFLEAVTAAVSAWAFLGEAMAPVQIAGGLAVFAGVVLASRGGATAGRRPGFEVGTRDRARPRQTRRRDRNEISTVLEASIRVSRASWDR